MTWDAFISYSHAADGSLAPAIQQGLQRLAKPWYRTRALRVFRDQTGLATDPHLWGSIEAALQDADYFVLLISPQAAESRWVNREIEYWVTSKDPAHLLPVLTDGTWAWDETTNDFDLVRSTAVPPALRGGFVGEPFYLDLRWARDESQLDLHNGRFRDAMAELAAPMHGKPKDDLVGDDIRLHRRARRLAWSAVAALTLLAIAAIAGAVIAVRNANSAEARRIEAVAQRLAAQAGQNDDRPDLAFLLAASSYRTDPTAETEGALTAAAQSLTTIELAAMLRHHDVAVTDIAVIPEFDLIVAGDAAGAITFSPREGAGDPGRADIGPDAVARILADPARGRAVVTGGVGVYVFDLETFSQVGPTAPLAAPVFDADIDRTSGMAAFAVLDGPTGVWDLSSDTPIAELPSPADGAQAVAVAPGGDLVATAHEQGTIRVWSLSDPQAPLWEQPEAHRGTATAAAFSPDGTQLASGGTDGIVKVWNVADGQLVLSGEIHGGVVRGLAFSRNHPAGRYLASVGTDGAIGWIDLDAGAQLPSTTVHLGQVNAIDFGNDGTYASGGADGLVAYFDRDGVPEMAATRTELGVIAARLSARDDPVRIAVALDDRVAIYDALGTPTGNEVAAAASGVAYLPDGRVVVAGIDDGLELWIPETGAIRPVAGTASGVTGLAVHPSGAMLAGIDESETVLIWDIEGEGPWTERRLPGGGWWAPAFDPAGTNVVYAGSPAQLIVADAATGTEVARLGRATELFFATSYHPDGTLLAAADDQGRVRFWDTDTFTESGAPLIGHRGAVAAIAFAAGGQRVVTAGADGTVRVWDLTRREQIGEALLSHERDILALAHLASADLTITGSADGTMLIRSLDAERWIDDGCRLIGRDLTADEITRFRPEPPYRSICPQGRAPLSGSG